jgi:polyhydroxybutyrate depolymerase
MMAHRLAIEHSDRIAAIATVAGTLAVDKCEPQRPVPVLHFHGTADPLVPFDGLPEKAMKPLQFKSVDETIAAWVKADGCPSQPVVEEIPEKAHDGMKITKKTYGPGSDRAEVVLFTIEGGGHTWPGVDLKLPFLGKTTQNIAATDLIWDFFQKHPIK